jgi:transcriptional regulator with XRE-family HTH domain
MQGKETRVLWKLSVTIRYVPVNHLSFRKGISMNRKNGKENIDKLVVFDNSLYGDYLAVLKEINEYSDEERKAWDDLFPLNKWDYKATIKIVGVLSYPLPGKIGQINTWTTKDPYPYGHTITVWNQDLRVYNGSPMTYEQSLLYSLNDLISALENDWYDDHSLKHHYPSINERKRALSNLYTKRASIGPSMYVFENLKETDSIGGRIKSLRERSGYTSEQMATMLGSRSHYRYETYETNENDIPISILVDLSRIFDVSTDWLLKGEINESKTPLIPEKSDDEPAFIKYWMEIVEEVKHRPQKEVVYISRLVQTYLVHRNS